LWFQRWNNENFRPTPDDFLGLEQSQEITDQRILDLIEDYRHYMNTGNQRRPDVWQIESFC
jgi:hypothetical protein